MDGMDPEGEALHLMWTTVAKVRLLSPLSLLLTPYSLLLSPHSVSFSPLLLFSSSHPVLCIAAAIAFIESRMSA
jgi:hypothetical protein